MNEITLEMLLERIKEYDEQAIPTIKKAYFLAEELHKNQKRQSGEPYIIHPLNVAYTLAEMGLDKDTICAGLLHDVVEDTQCTLEDIEKHFNKRVAILVDGVTKMKDMNLSTKEEEISANTRKIIVSLRRDVRIIIIKLADRLHNMRTLEFKSEYKQKEKAAETMDLFAPMANTIGAYRIKNELEDLSFKYLLPDDFIKYKELHDTIFDESRYYMLSMTNNIKEILRNYNIENQIKMRIKHIYGIYKMIEEQGLPLSKIHDLRDLKVILPTVEECCDWNFSSSIYSYIKNITCI